jgi:DUF4097 and DUF4098 domain-containing protein YvlB
MEEKMKKSYKLFLTGSILILLTSFLYSEGMRDRDWSGRNGNVQNQEETQPFFPGDTLKINLQTGGSLKISGGEGDTAHFAMIRRGDAVEEAEVKISRSGKIVELETRYYSLRGGSGGIDVIITLPSQCQILLDTLGGDVEMDNLSGEFGGKTLGGDIILQRLSGKVNLETLGGDISVSQSALDGRVKTLGGDINISRNQGNLDANTLGGEVNMVDSESINTTRSDQESPVKIDSLGGDITIDRAPAGVYGKTLGGDILINRAQVFADLETLGGDIEIENINGSIKARTLGGNISAVMTGDPAAGDRGVLMSSMGGDLKLTLPENLDMTVELTIDITKKARGKYQIISPLDLEITEREATLREKKDDIERVITAVGVIGRGTHRIELNTINGNITLEQK